MEIVRAGAERIPELRPLWESLSAHHAEVAPELPDDEWLSEAGAFALLAEIEGEPVGYAVVHIRGPEETWATGDRVGELETLAVLPGHRGRGIGRALVERMLDELREEGVSHFTVGVIASNADAVRFYERLGLTRFIVTYAGRVPGDGAL